MIPVLCQSNVTQILQQQMYTSRYKNILQPFARRPQFFIKGAVGNSSQQQTAAG
jgi:hypothetical protein